VRVLVAGGAGLIGSHLCARLVGEGHEVVCVDNLLTGRVENVADLEGRAGFDFVRADIVSDPLPGGRFDLVANLACPASPADFGPLAEQILRVGSVGLLNLLERARRDQAVFLQASTSEVYGDPLVHPQPETYFGNVNPVGPRAVYDESKRFGEAAASAWRRRYGLRVRIARIFNTYGPHMRLDDGRVVSNFVVQALRGQPLTVYGDGRQTRSFCYVADQVEGLLRLAASDYEQPVNVGNDAERTVLEVAELVLALVGSKAGVVHAPKPEDDPAQRRPDLSVARSRLGFEPQVSLEEGLARTVEWFRRRVRA